MVEQLEQVKWLGDRDSNSDYVSRGIDWLYAGCMDVKNELILREFFDARRATRLLHPAVNSRPSKVQELAAI